MTCNNELMRYMVLPLPILFWKIECFPSRHIHRARLYNFSSNIWTSSVASTSNSRIALTSISFYSIKFSIHSCCSWSFVCIQSSFFHFLLLQFLEFTDKIQSPFFVTNNVFNWNLAAVWKKCYKELLNVYVRKTKQQRIMKVQ